jgi:hypothetical protein
MQTPCTDTKEGLGTAKTSTHFLAAPENMKLAKSLDQPGMQVKNLVLHVAEDCSSSKRTPDPHQTVGMPTKLHESIHILLHTSFLIT